MYDAQTGTVSTQLTGANPAVFTSDTISRILALTTSANDTTVTIEQVTVDANGGVTVPTGTEVVMVTSSDTDTTTVKPPLNAPVVIFQGLGGVNVDFTANTPNFQRVVVGSAGDDTFKLGGGNTQLTLGTGHNVVTGGSGHDTVIAGLGDSTIVGGEHTTVQMVGGSGDYHVEVVNGHAILTKITAAGSPASGASGPAGAPAAAVTTDVSHVQFIQLDNKEALVLANTSKEAAVASLFHTAFGRDADAAGLDFWFKAADSGTSMLTIAQGFTTSAEYKALAAQNDSDFLTSLYHNTFDRAGDTDGMAYWGNLLATGHSRAEVIASFAQTAAFNLDGTLHTETNLVGSVTIVHGIV
jgi:hypothetical protein